MAKYWLKLYYEILDDPKMGRLPDRHYRRVIESFSLAGEMDAGGLLPTIEDMAWRLHLAPDELITDLQYIEQTTRIIHQNGDGKWWVTKFAERQDASTEAERKAYQRQRDRKELQSVTIRDNSVTNNVTNAVRELELELESELKLELETTTSRPNIFTLYENTIGLLTPMIRDELIQAEADYPADWIEDAFRETARQNKHSWKYTAAILKSWKRNGYKSNGTKAEQEPYATETWG
jgi:DnaD/phage-associated family protein